MKRLALTTVLALAAFAACSSDKSIGPADVADLVVSPTNLTVDTKQTVLFTAYGRTANHDSVAVAVTWTASGGVITPLGWYTTDTDSGDYSITARDAAGHVASTQVHAGRHLNQVVLVPSSAALATGGAMLFKAYGLSKSGDSTAVTVTFSATGGGITSGGNYTAGQNPGTYRVIASYQNLADTSTVTVSTTQPPPPAGVNSVEVTPSTATIDVNATYQLRANLLDASGNILADRTISWTSSNSSVASVDGTGLVRGATAGTATITAESEGKSATAAITVNAPVPPAAECAAAHPEWIWCDDFEQDRTASYFEYDNAGGNFVRTNGAGYNGSVGMRGHWNTGAQDAGSLHLAIGATPSSYFRPVGAGAGTANYREVYWRMYVKNQAGWTGGGGDKLSRAFVFANSNWAEAALAHVWSGTSASTDGQYLMIDPASGTDAAGNLLTTGYNDFAHLTWLGAARSTTPIFDAAHVGQWYCVEAHARLNSAGSANGVFELWINGTMEAQRTGLNFLGSYSAYGINAVYFENYWNAGSVASQDRFFDNIVVSTARIGC